MIQHRNLVNYIFMHLDYYSMTSEDRSMHYATLSFDARFEIAFLPYCFALGLFVDLFFHFLWNVVSMAEIWPTLAIGASLWQCCDDEVRLNPIKLWAWIAKNKITIFFLTTQLAGELLQVDYPPDLAVRVMFTGGESCFTFPHPPFFFLSSSLSLFLRLR